jgi:Ca-activated chloride channel family protein
MGNYKDSKLELLADKENGNHAYIDDIQEARKVLVNEFGGTLFTVAKDVKIQVEFNPAVVQAYRLVGYENRLLNAEDFKDDKKDAGEMGAGHTVTVLYEIIPVGVKSPFMKNIDSLKYQQQTLVSSGDEIATIKTRYKKPDGNASIEMIQPVPNQGKEFQTVSQNTRFAAAVAMFGMLLRDSEFKGTSSFDDVLAIARNARGEDPEEYRAEFIRLVKTVKDLPISKNEK